MALRFMNNDPPAFASRFLSRFPSLLPYLATAVGLWCLLAVLMPLLAPASLSLRLLGMPNVPATAEIVAQQAWFGMAAAPDMAVPESTLTLVGVMGSGVADGGDFAIVQEAGVTMVLRPGASSPAGWVLVKVEGQGVVVSRGGVEQRIMLQRAAQPPMEAPRT